MYHSKPSDSASIPTYLPNLDLGQQQPTHVTGLMVLKLPLSVINHITLHP